MQNRVELGPVHSSICLLPPSGQTADKTIEVCALCWGMRSFLISRVINQIRCILIIIGECTYPSAMTAKPSLQVELILAIFTRLNSFIVSDVIYALNFLEFYRSFQHCLNMRTVKIPMVQFLLHASACRTLYHLKKSIILLLYFIHFNNSERENIWFLIAKNSLFGLNSLHRSNRQIPLAFSDLILYHKVVSTQICDTL